MKKYDQVAIILNNQPEGRGPGYPRCGTKLPQLYAFFFLLKCLENKFRCFGEYATKFTISDIMPKKSRYISTFSLASRSTSLRMCDRQCMYGSALHSLMDIFELCFLFVSQQWSLWSVSEKIAWLPLHQLSWPTRATVFTKNFVLSVLSAIVKNPVKTMIWGCMSAAGVGLHEIVEAVTNHGEAHPSTEDFVFQGDNAPCHSAIDLKSWLGSCCVRLLNWSGQSPDLNPIEELWQKVSYEI